jgi:hypothetical protein
MKNQSTFFLFVLSSVIASAQSFIGAWESDFNGENGDTFKSVAIFTDNFKSVATFNATKGEFIETKGGSWKFFGDTMTEKIEFDTTNSSLVDSKNSFKVAVTDSIFSILGTVVEFKRIDDGLPGKLQGAWLMSGRRTNGETQLRNTDTPRKTMKILSGTRFQWIAYNTETKEFMGTGGGTYSTENKEYIEKIEFFSRDKSRVGASLDFNYNLVDGNWHHSGLSSKGEPIFEIWSLRK